MWLHLSRGVCLIKQHLPDITSPCLWKVFPSVYYPDNFRPRQLPWDMVGQNSTGIRGRRFLALRFLVLENRHVVSNHRAVGPSDLSNLEEIIGTCKCWCCGASNKHYFESRQKWTRLSDAKGQKYASRARISMRWQILKLKMYSYRSMIVSAKSMVLRQADIFSLAYPVHQEHTWHTPKT